MSSSVENWKTILIKENTPILDVIKIMDQGAMGVVLVIDDSENLLGVVTDGDVRRGFLNGVGTDQSVKLIMNREPITAKMEETREAILQKMQLLSLHHMPLIDPQGCLAGLELMDDLVKSRQHDNLVFIMAGGLGERLRPLTNDCPKPLLKIDSKPMLQIILEGFINNGFSNFVFAINYRGKMIREHFQDGSQWGVNITYVEERKRLGTAGPLSLLKEKQKLPFIVMNGDIMTNVNFQQLLDFHCQQKNYGTVCVREYQQTVPYGVVKINKHQLLAVEEKPIQNYFVNAGIYVFEPDVLRLLETNQPMDMPQLLDSMLHSKLNISAFPIREYWTDIGRMEDYQKAHQDYQEHFA